LVIMVNGKFKCLGSIQHLKSKYGQGFTLVLKIGSKYSGGYGNNNAPRARSAFEGIILNFTPHAYTHEGTHTQTQACMNQRIG